MRAAVFLIFLGWMLIRPALWGQPAESYSSPEPIPSSSCWLLEDARHFLKVGEGLMMAPFRFSGAQWGQVGLILGGTAVFFLVDPAVRDLAVNNRSELNDLIFNFDAYHGDKYTFAFSWMLYGGGIVLKQGKVRMMGLLSLEAFLYAGALTHILKTVIGRRRPYGGENHLVFKPFRGETLYRSLPSGHATGAFAVSTVMAKSLPNLWWKGFWYGSAVMVAASRVYHGAHWLSDVFWGSVVGYSVASLVVNLNSVVRPQASRRAFRLQPFLALAGVGVRIDF